MKFVTPSRKLRFTQLGYLFQHMFTILGRNLSIARPIIKMSLYAVVMLCIFVAVLAHIVDAIKEVYYTLFYARVNHVDKLAPDIRGNLDGYLKLEREPGDEIESAPVQ